MRKLSAHSGAPTPRYAMQAASDVGICEQASPACIRISKWLGRTNENMKALPKTLYVRREVDRDESYLVAEETVRDQSDLAEKRIVGEYKLVQMLVVSAEVKAVKK